MREILVTPQLFIDVVAIVFPAALLTINRADSVVLSMLVLTGLYISLRCSSSIRFTTLERMLLMAFASVFVAAIAAYLFGSQTSVGFRMLGRDIRFLLFIPIYLVFRCIPPRRQTVFIGIALGSIVIGVYALVEYFHYGVERVGAVSGPIEFGDIALVTAVSSLSLPLAFAGAIYRKYLYWLTAVAIVCGLIASFLSGTRGGWIALPILALLIFFTIAHISKRHLWRYAVGMLLLIGLSVSLVPRAMLIARISDAMDQTRIFYRFRQIAGRDDVKTGCQDDAEVLRGILSVMKLYGISNELATSVENDDVELRKSTQGQDCKSGYVLHVANISKNEAIPFTIPRSVTHVYGFQKLEIIARGQAVLSLFDGTGKNIHFDINSGYKRVTLIDNTPTDDSEPPVPWPVLTLEPGAQVSFVPYSVYDGEYTSFYALGPVGARLELWAAAWMLFRDHPLFGAGTGAFMEGVYPLVSTGLVAPHIAAYDHPHNDYLNFMACEGLLGIAGFLLVTLIPVRIYWDASVYSREVSVRSAGLCGLLMVVGILIFSFTESLFVHSLVIGWYVVMTALLCAVIRTYDTRDMTEQRGVVPTL